MNIDTDKQYQESRVESVRPCESGWEVAHGGWTLFVTSEQCQYEPKPGEIMRCYGRGIGYTVRGVAIGGRVYRYKTEAEQERQDYLAAEQRRKLDALERSRPERDANAHRRQQSTNSRGRQPPNGVASAAAARDGARPRTNGRRARAPLSCWGAVIWRNE
jgi:hypothetical protein